MKSIGKVRCVDCGYYYVMVGQLGKGWLSYSFRCDNCGKRVTINRVTAKEVMDFKTQLSKIKTIDDFLDL